MNADIVYHKQTPKMSIVFVSAAVSDALRRFLNPVSKFMLSITCRTLYVVYGGEIVYFIDVARHCTRDHIMIYKTIGLLPEPAKFWEFVNFEIATVYKCDHVHKIKYPQCYEVMFRENSFDQFLCLFEFISKKSIMSSFKRAYAKIAGACGYDQQMLAQLNATLTRKISALNLLVIVCKSIASDASNMYKYLIPDIPENSVFGIDIGKYVVKPGFDLAILKNHVPPAFYNKCVNMRHLITVVEAGDGSVTSFVGTFGPEEYSGIILPNKHLSVMHAMALLEIGWIIPVPKSIGNLEVCKFLCSSGLIGKNTYAMNATYIKFINQREFSGLGFTLHGYKYVRARDTFIIEVAIRVMLYYRVAAEARLWFNVGRISAKDFAWIESFA